MRISDWSSDVCSSDLENKVDKIAALPSALYTSTVDPSKTALVNKYSVWQLEKSTPKVRATLGAYWESGMFSVNLRESFYSKVSSLTTAPSACTCPGDITIPVKSAFITDLELGRSEEHTSEIQTPMRI